MFLVVITKTSVDLHEKIFQIFPSQFSQKHFIDRQSKNKFLCLLLRIPVVNLSIRTNISRDNLWMSVKV